MRDSIRLKGIIFTKEEILQAVKDLDEPIPNLTKVISVHGLIGFVLSGHVQQAWAKQNGCLWAYTVVVPGLDSSWSYINTTDLLRQWTVVKD